MRILIIEDEIQTAKLIKSYLENNGHRADYYTDGISGGQAVEVSHDNYDILLLDLMLPGKDGFSILGEMHKKNIHLPVIIITGLGSLSDILTAYTLGAHEYLVKPFTFKELKAKIKEVERVTNS